VPGPLTSEDILDLRVVGDVQLSPDGSLVVYAVVTLDRDANEQRSSLWLARTDGSTPPRRLTQGPRRDSRPRFSPDGTRLAFLSNRDREWRADLHVLGLDGGEATRETVLPRGIADFAWSPDGTRFALVGLPAWPQDPDRLPPKDDDEARQRYGERVRHVERFKYRMDPQIVLEDEPAQLWVRDIGGGDPVPITEGEFAVSQPAWTADGHIAFLSNRSEDHDRTWVADVWTCTADGSDLRRETGGDLQIGAFAFNRNGVLALFGNQAAGGWKGANTRLIVAEHDLTASLDRTVGAHVLGDMSSPGAPKPTWHEDGSLWFQLSDRGQVHVYRARSGELPKAVLSGRRIISHFAVAGATIAFTSSSHQDPLSLCVADLEGGGERQIEVLNPWLADRDLGRLQELNFELDGDTIDGWALLPSGAAEGEKSPTLLYIHGGPHGAYGWSFSHMFSVLAGAGYAVIYCNPPGSQSYGEAFSQRINGHWGELDLPYFLALADAAEAAGFADPDRLGVGGASYGGFSTLWAVGHSDRFKAAVAARPVSDMNAFYGSADIGAPFMAGQMGGEPWDDAAQETYRRLSPVTYVKDIRTPLRLIASTGDIRTPLEQAEQVFIRLRRLERTVDLKIFNGEPHGLVVLGKPWNRVRHMRAILEWFDRYL